MAEGNGQDKAGEIVYDLLARMQRAEPAERYDLCDRDAEDLLTRFSYHPPQPDQPPRYEVIRDSGLGLAIGIYCYAPAGRERSLAITKLEEAVMWANAAIARGEAGEVEP